MLCAVENHFRQCSITGDSPQYCKGKALRTTRILALSSDLPVFIGAIDNRANRKSNISSRAIRKRVVNHGC